MRWPSSRPFGLAIVLAGGCFADPPRIGSDDVSSSGSGTDATDSADATSGSTSSSDTSTGQDAEATSMPNETTSSSDTSGPMTSDTQPTATDDATDGSETGTPAQCMHLIFVTSTATTANLAGLDGADGRCAELAANQGLEGEWRAVLSTEAVAAKDRLDVVGPVCDLNEQVIAHDAAEWWSATHTHRLTVTEAGEPLPDGAWRVWTGTNVHGERTGADCSGWTVDAGAGVTVGDATRTDGWWIEALPPQIPQCSFDARLYCLQQ